LLRRGKSHGEAPPCAVVALALALAACETVHDHVEAGGVIGVVVRPTAASAQSTESTENLIKQGHPTHVAMMGMLFLFASLRATHFAELYNTCAWGRRGPSRAACWVASSISSGVTTRGNRRQSKVREEARSLDLPRPRRSRGAVVFSAGLGDHNVAPFRRGGDAPSGATASSETGRDGARGGSDHW
jgi:hypothetical protein